MSTGFDFISKFNLDSPNLERFGKSVTRIPGSNKYQTAYRFRKDADLRIPNRSVETESNRWIKISVD